MINIIRKQQIIDLFKDCDVEIHVEDPSILYYKNDKWFGAYYLENENFIYSLYNFSKLFGEDIKDNELKINELSPILEDIIKRKISTINAW